MDLRLAFTEFLFAFCAVALADRVHGVCARLTAALFGRRAPTSRRPAAATGGTWYVYFSRDAVTGQPRLTPPRVVPGARPAARPAHVVDRRPRLRA